MQSEERALDRNFKKEFATGSAESDHFYPRLLQLYRLRLTQQGQEGGLGVNDGAAGAGGTSGGGAHGGGHSMRSMGRQLSRMNSDTGQSMSLTAQPSRRTRESHGSHGAAGAMDRHSSLSPTALPHADPSSPGPHPAAGAGAGHAHAHAHGHGSHAHARVPSPLATALSSSTLADVQVRVWRHSAGKKRHCFAFLPGPLPS